MEKSIEQNEKMAESFIVSSPEKFERVKNAIVESGAENLHILADFDRTLTKAFVGGKEVPSMISVLRDHNYLTPDYPDKAKALFTKYHAIEISNEIPKAEKIKAMAEWWRTHYGLLIASKLNKKDVESAAKSGNVELRDGVVDFLDLLKEKKIPMAIISASGLGSEAINMYLDNAGISRENIFVVSNEFEWDKDGYMIKAKEPIIHNMNKNETTLAEFPFFKELENRKNVILLGDSLDDVRMAEGSEHENILTFGFLNKNVEENLENYKKVFDAIITNDGGMGRVTEIIKALKN